MWLPSWLAPAIALDGVIRNATQLPPGVIAPIVMNPNMSTSCTKWMNHAKKKPRVSSMDLVRTMLIRG
jgi:hypothetical protein